MNTQPIVLFDGVCNLCNGTVQFIIKHDKKKKFRFASLQGQHGKAMSEKFHLSTDSPESIILVDGEKIFTRSTAALTIAKDLGGFFKILYAAIIVPRFLRDAVYNLIAKNRYRWFGKMDECPIPTVDLQDRFLD